MLDDLEEEKGLVYQAALQLIEIKGLEGFIEYLQEVEEQELLPKSTALDHRAYVAVLRQAVNDYRRRLFP